MKSSTYKFNYSLHTRLICSILSVVLFMNIAAETVAAPDKEALSKVKVLILTGAEMGAHNWKTRTAALEEVLAENARFEVGVETDPEFLANDKLFEYDVILMNFYSGEKDYPGKKSKENLVKFIAQDGKGLFILHFACGNFHDWPEFSNIAGLVFTPRGRYHDPYQAFDVNITDPDHQITRGLKPTLKAHDECYFCLGGATRDYDILATATSKDTKKPHPMAFTVNYGKGRVFHTPLGHDVQSVKMPDVAELIRRGLVWAAGKE